VNHLPEATDNPTRPIRHHGSCGRRGWCWRPICRALGVRTVEYQANGYLMCHGHGSRYRLSDVDFAAELWAHVA